jgi:serine phosphatase RsbU (regulator of sigma subunit)/ligand-binding sensor domain-containing protein
MIGMHRIFLLGWCLILVPVKDIFSQNIIDAYGTYPIKNITAGRLLPNGLVENLFLDSKNRLWIGTRMGLCCYMGSEMKVFNKSDGLIEHCPRSIAEDSDGRIYVGYLKGINVIEGETVKKLEFPDSLSTYGLSKIIRNNEDEMVFFFLNWIGVWKNDSLLEAKLWKNKDLINKVYYANNEDEYWVSTGREGLYKITNEDTIKTGINLNEATAIIKDKTGNIWISIWDKKIFRFDGGNITVFQTDAIVTNFIVTEGNILWGATFDRGLMKIEELNRRPEETTIEFFGANNGFSGGSLWTLIEDLDGNIWTGNFGSGISVFSGEHLINFNKNQGFPGNNINMTLSDTSNVIWSATDDGILKLSSDGRIIEQFDRERFPNLPNNKFKCIYIDDDQTVYSHIYGDVFTKIKNNGKVEFYEIPAGFYIDISEDTISFGSDYRGIERYDKHTLSKIDCIEVDSKRSRNRVPFLTYDRERSTYFFVNTEGEFFGYSVNKKELIDYTPQLASIAINRVRWAKKDHQGNYWLGGEGLANVTINDSIITINDYFSEKDGLPGLFSIYGFIELEENELVIATNNGVALLDINNYYAYQKATFQIIGMNQGMNASQVVHASKDLDKNYWFSTGGGLYKFVPEKLSAKNSLPTIYISGLNLFLNNVDWTEELASNKYERIDFLSKIPIQPVFHYNQNHLTFNFQGVHLTKYDDLVYSTFLEGFDKDWSNGIRANYVTYSNLPSGNYTFHVKASLNNKDWTIPVVYRFTIHPPFWRTMWFLAVSAFLTIALVLYIIDFRTRKLKSFAKKLEHKVEERTIELSTAYKNIEQKNTEILDSITYAKRLQDAILPPTKLVSTYLIESFILYKPKDIVAGDFYFMDVVEEGDKKLIYYVAADCTGHGVPGAMVSIVGANGLKRCIQEFKLRNPGKILDKLAQLVAENFSQSEEKIRDGMDLALCCLEMENNTAIKVHYAGANNPLWVINPNRKTIPKGAAAFKEGGGFEIKANKQGIGYTENISPFITHIFEVEAGDTLYTFSDGYPDQFGGEAGKKYKSVNFRKFLLSIQGKNMDEQKKLVNEEFENWRGELEQVDDVCVIGVRL